MKPAILIYRDRLLPISETFIKEQAASLRRFSPYFLGVRPTDGIELLSEETILIGRDGQLGRLREILFKRFHFAPAAMRKVKQLNPSLVHAHFGLDGVEALPVAAALDVPLVVTFHGFDATTKDEYMRQTRRGRRFISQKHKLMASQVKLLAVSNFIARKVVDQGFPEDRVSVHYVGVDTEKFRPDPQVRRENVILFVGRLVEVKGAEYVIRAASLLQTEMPGLELVIIGDGPLRSELEQLARCENCRCLFLGAQTPEVIRSWMHRAKVMCNPSVRIANGNEEGFGIVFIEAQSMELPVVSFSSGGIPEAVEDEVTGLLAPERDWRALARHLKNLLEDGDKWTRFSRAARRRVCQKFDIKKRSKLLEDIYDQVLDKWSADPDHDVHR